MLRCAFNDVALKKSALQATKTTVLLKGTASAVPQTIQFLLRL
jgi:hypothetical protein